MIRKILAFLCGVAASGCFVAICAMGLLDYAGIRMGSNKVFTSSLDFDLCVVGIFVFMILYLWLAPDDREQKQINKIYKRLYGRKPPMRA